MLHRNELALIVGTMAPTVQAYVCAASAVAQGASKTCQIKVEDLTPEAFRPFGQVGHMRDHKTIFCCTTDEA
jgi:hypothetical protein